MKRGKGYLRIFWNGSVLRKGEISGVRLEVMRRFDFIFFLSKYIINIMISFLLDL